VNTYLASSVTGVLGQVDYPPLRLHGHSGPSPVFRLCGRRGGADARLPWIPRSVAKHSETNRRLSELDQFPVSFRGYIPSTFAALVMSSLRNTYLETIVKVQAQALLMLPNVSSTLLRNK